MHRFASLGLKSRITARRRANLGQSLQRFPSLTPEIKNHCSPGVVAVCRRNHSSLRQRRLESDAEDRCSHGSCRRNHSSLRQRKLESDAEYRCRHGRSRRNYSSLRQRILESDAEPVPQRLRQAGRSTCRTLEGVNRQNPASIPKSGPEIKNRCTQKSVNRQNLASIPKSGPEIKNRCTQEGLNREKLASILKSGPVTNVIESM